MCYRSAWFCFVKSLCGFMFFSSSLFQANVQRCEGHIRTLDKKGALSVITHLSLAFLSLTWSFRHLIEIIALWCTQVCCIHYQWAILSHPQAAMSQCKWNTKYSSLFTSQTCGNSELKDRVHVCLSAFVSCIMKLIKQDHVCHSLKIVFWLCGSYCCCSQWGL